MVVNTNAEVTSRGVVYTLRSVREARVASSHTLRVYYILQTWVFLCLLSTLAVVGQNIEQADVSTHAFYL